MPKSQPVCYQLLSSDMNFLGTVTPISPSHVLSTCHQLLGISKNDLKVLQSGIYRKAKVVHEFPYIDIAVLEVEGGFDLYFKLTTELNIDKKEKYYASGYNPTISYDPLISSGSVIGISTEDLSNILPIDCRVILSDIRTNSGFSGGPLYYQGDKLLGIIAGRIFPIPDEASIGLYAIPSLYIQRYLNINSLNKLKEVNAKIIKRTNIKDNLIYVEYDPNLILEKDSLVVNIDGIKFCTLEEFHLLFTTMKRGTSYLTILKGKHRIKIFYK